MGIYSFHGIQAKCVLWIPICIISNNNVPTQNTFQSNDFKIGAT